MKEVAASLEGNADEQLKKIEEEWMRMQLLIPSIPSPAVPVGKDDSENVEKRTWGEIRKFDFKPRDHVELGKI